MTLSEMADYVTAKVGQTDAQSVAICKTFIDRRYRMIWDAALWKDTQIMSLASQDPNDVTQVFMPREMERVMKIRDIVNQSNLAFGTIGTLMEYDPSLFTETGTETAFVHLPSLATPTVLPVDSQVTATPASFPGSDPNSYVGMSFYVKGKIATYGAIVGESVEFSTPDTDVTTQNTYSEIYAISKPITGGLVSFAAFTGIGILYPSDTCAPQYARVKLLPAKDSLSGGMRFLCYGKRRCEPVVNDGDVPLITGIDNALLMYAQADMLQRQRQYAKSQAILAEATAQVQELLDLEKNQMAYEQRVIPVPVNTQWYYDDFFGARGKSYW